MIYTIPKIKFFLYYHFFLKKKTNRHSYYSKQCLPYLKVTAYTHTYTHTRTPNENTQCLHFVYNPYFLKITLLFLFLPILLKKNCLIFKSYYFSLCLYFSLIFHPKLYIYISHYITPTSFLFLSMIPFIPFYTLSFLILTIFIVPWCSIRTSQKECARQSHGLFDSPSIQQQHTHLDS